MIFSLVMLTLSSIWMAAVFTAMRRTKTSAGTVQGIELVYCCIQLLVGLLTIRFGMGLAGGVIMIALAGSVYLLYINPRFIDALAEG